MTNYNSKKMTKHILLVLLIVIGTSCSKGKKYNKTQLISVETIYSDIIAEHYRVNSFGVGGDVYNLYLTDKSTFRKHICKYYDNEHFNYLLTDSLIEIVRIRDKYVSPTGEINEEVELARIKVNINKEKGSMTFE